MITAGAPGSGKTTLLRQDLEKERANGKSYAYICPDDVCLQQQTKTYQADLKNSDSSFEEFKAAYDKWRPGSNAATHLILANLIREKYAFYFGSTSSGPATGKSFEFLKNQGYQIKLLHVTAPDQVRWESIQERDKTFVQTTEEDVRNKGLLVPQRINDTYLKYADEIAFYYRAAADQDAKLAARWIRSSDPSESLGTLEIVDSSLYEQIKKIHNAVADGLNRPDLKWETAVEGSSKILASVH